jgi:hypothetical protein
LTTTFNPELMENRFQRWYAELAKRLNLNPDSDAPGNNYDWRAAWRYLDTTARPLTGPDFALPDVFGSLDKSLPTFTPPFNEFKTLTPSPLASTIAEMNLRAPAQTNRSFTSVAQAPAPVKLATPPLPVTPGPTPTGRWVDVPDISTVPTGELLKMLPDKDLIEVAQAHGIQPKLSLGPTPPQLGGQEKWANVVNVEVPGHGIVEFPAGMTQEAMERVIQEQLFGQKPAPGAPPEIYDPMAESLGMFQPVVGAKELGKQIAEHGQAAGTLATAAATKLPGAVVAPITGMAVAAGGLLNRAYTGKDTPITPEEQALMEQGLPFATGEMARDFLTGVGAEFGGRGIAWGAGKLLAPAAGKITEGGRALMNFAKKYNLPFSPEAAVPKLWRSKLGMALADTGVGRWFTTRQRRELVEGASEAAGKVLDDLGLPAPLAPTEAAGDLGSYLRQLANKKLTHKAFNEAMERIPGETEMTVPNLMAALDDIGGLQTISNIYAGKSGKAPREFGLFKRIINREGRITKTELDWFNKNIWRKWKDMDPEARAAAGKLKEGLLKDLDGVLDPELGQTLGAIRTAADDAYKQAEAFLQGTPLAGALRKATRPEAQARQFFNLFSEGHAQDALAIRDHLIGTGNKDLWDTVKASYLEGVFSRATKLSEETGERVFQPGAFINWFDKYGKGAGEVMPEHAAALTEWYNVSKGLLQDFKKFGERGKEGVIPSLKLGTLTGAGYLAGGVPGVVVSNGFALLSALGTMGKGNLGFIRNYLLKESAPFGTAFAKQAAELGGVEGLQRFNQGGQGQAQGGRWVNAD